MTRHGPGEVPPSLTTSPSPPPPGLAARLGAAEGSGPALVAVLLVRAVDHVEKSNLLIAVVIVGHDASNGHSVPHQCHVAPVHPVDVEGELTHIGRALPGPESLLNSHGEVVRAGCHVPLSRRCLEVRPIGVTHQHRPVRIQVHLGGADLGILPLLELVSLALAPDGTQGRRCCWGDGDGGSEEEGGGRAGGGEGGGAAGGGGGGEEGGGERQTHFGAEGDEGGEGGARLGVCTRALARGPAGPLPSPIPYAYS